MLVRILIRRGTSAEWNLVNPILAEGEPGWDTTTGQLKIGDGSNQWSELDWVTLTAEQIEQIIDLLESGVDINDGVMTAVLAEDTSDFTTELASMVASQTNPVGAAIAATYATPAQVNSITAPLYVGRTSRARHAPALGLYFPEAEGAVGDGTTDDTTAFQTALGLARAAKATLLLAAGVTYILSATLNPADAKVDGQRATLKQKAGITAVPFFTATTGPVNICDLNIDGNRANTTLPASSSVNGSGIYVFRSTGGDAGLISNITAKNLYGPAVRVAGTRQTDPKNTTRTPGTILNLRADTCAYGVYLDAARDMRVLSGCITNVDTVGIQEQYGCDNVIQGVTVDGTGTSHGILTQYSFGTSITSCRVRRTGTAITVPAGTSSTGIQVGGGSTTNEVAKSFTIANNVIEDAFHYGISVDPTITGSAGVVQTVQGTITGNVCIANGLRAYALDNTQNGGSGIYAHNAGQLLITGNLCKGNQYAGIIDDGLDNVITGNEVIDNIVYGVELRCASGETKGRCTLSGNKFRNNPTQLSVSQYAISGDLALPATWLSKSKPADQTVTNTTTFVSDTDLAFTGVPPGTYEILGSLVVDSSQVADFRGGFLVPAGTDLTWTLDAFATSATSAASPILRTPTVVSAGSGTVGTNSAGGVGSGSKTVMLPRGLLKLTQQGDVTFRFAQGTAEATNTILCAGSYLRLVRIG